MITVGKEIYMVRPSKFLLVSLVVIFLLACNLATQPIREAQNLEATAKAIGSAVPVETLKALPSAIPIETLEALPSLAPTLEAFETRLPDFGNIFNPLGTPAQEWKGIPIMPQATAVQEFPQNNTYSVKATATMKEVQDFYKEKMTALGWNEPFNLPTEGDAGLLVFQKEGSTLTITITSSEDSCVVVLTLSS
jgi:hypothetical protein